MPAGDLDLPRLQIAMPLPDVGAQLRQRRIGGRVMAREHIPHAAPALQPDVPDPAMLLRGRHAYTA